LGSVYKLTYTPYIIEKPTKYETLAKLENSSFTIKFVSPKNKMKGYLSGADLSYAIGTCPDRIPAIRLLINQTIQILILSPA
jgi:hypothetical protein